jgi:hypothetical protein
VAASLDVERETEIVTWHGAMRRPGSGTKGELLEPRATIERT